MTHTHHESVSRRLLDRLRAHVAADSEMKIDVPRAQEYDRTLICDVLENRRLCFELEACWPFCCRGKMGS